MPGYVDLRPPAVNLHFRPGDTLTVDLTWPAGSLVGRTFTSTLDAASLGVAIVGDVMTVTATGAQTAAVTGTAAWVLTETTAGGSNEALIGRWVPSTSPNDETPSSFELVLPDGSLGVDVTGQAGLTAHAAASTVATVPLHGVIEHRWAQHGWAPFTRKVVNQDGSQSFTLSVNGDYGRVTGSVAGSENHREIHLHGGMLATDGEITVVLHGPSTYVSSPSINRPQMGVVCRYQLIGGFHVAFVAWYDIFVGNPAVLNVSGWRGDGSSTLNQAAGGQYTAEVGRDLRIIAAQRFSFIGYINELTCIPPHLHGLATGDTVTVDCDDNTFDATAVALSGADRSLATLQYAEDVTNSAVTNKVANGTVQLSNQHQRFFPYLLKARLVGNVLSVKAWRGRMEPEPTDWQLTQTVATDADFPQLPAGPGLFGIVAAHAHDSSYLEYGDITFRKLA